jgi:hypothetical protein
MWIERGMSVAVGCSVVGGIPESGTETALAALREFGGRSTVFDDSCEWIV